MSTKKTSLWILSIITALPFIASSIAKLTSQQILVEQFERWGFPLWFMYFTGVVLLFNAILLLIPKARIFGGIILACTMLVATIVHLINNEAGQIIAPLVLGSLAFSTAYFQYKVNSQSKIS